jgi:5-methylcytosine-specific restriction protein A
VKCLKPRLGTRPSTAQGTGWKPDTVRGNRHQRGYGAAWEKTRERILERDNGICQPHLQRGLFATGNQVDHVISKAEGRARGWSRDQIEADANLQTICGECHREKTARESRQPGGGQNV